MHIIVVDLGYGDAGKGTVVDWLCVPRPDAAPVAAVVRFNGGAQAAHNVVTADGRHHTFAQFGSGTLAASPPTCPASCWWTRWRSPPRPGTSPSLGVPDPLALLTVDGDALLTTPYHAAANRARERARGAARHGSCGMGIGETAAYALAHPDDAPRPATAPPARPCAASSPLLRDRLTAELGPLDAPPVDDCLAACTAFADRVTLVDETHLPGLLRRGPVVFEGAQGVLLDEWHGFHPYTTWSTTTFDSAETLLAEAGRPHTALRLGVVRTYTTRHGPGPLVTEDPALAAALPEPHNGHGRWQGAVPRRPLRRPSRTLRRRCLRGSGRPRRHPSRRPGPPPCAAPRPRLPHPGRTHGPHPGRAAGRPPPPTSAHRTPVERLPGRWQTPGSDPHAWTDALSTALSAPVLLESYGPTAADKAGPLAGPPGGALAGPPTGSLAGPPARAVSAGRATAGRPGSRSRCPETSPA